MVTEISFTVTFLFFLTVLFIFLGHIREFTIISVLGGFLGVVLVFLFIPLDVLGLLFLLFYFGVIIFEVSR